MCLSKNNELVLLGYFIRSVSFCSYYQPFLKLFLNAVIQALLELSEFLKKSSHLGGVYKGNCLVKCSFPFMKVVQSIDLSDFHTLLEWMADLR